MNFPKGFLYSETQRMRGTGIYRLVMIIFAIVTIFVTLPYFKPSGMKNRGEVLLPLLIVFAVWLIVSFLMSKTSLEIGIRDDGFYFRMKPFMFSFKRIRFDEIESVELIGLNAFKYGFGIHFGIGWKAYTIVGDQGIKINLKKGKSIVLSVRNPESIIAILSQYVKIRS